jgi:hypothetical protein
MALTSELPAQPVAPAIQMRMDMGELYVVEGRKRRRRQMTQRKSALRVKEKKKGPRAPEKRGALSYKTNNSNVSGLGNLNKKI